jgi:DNA polymerase-1
VAAPLLAIDGDSLGHRAYHAMPPVAGAGGQPVGLLLGFANMLVATWDALRPRAVLVCLDARTPSYRHELLPGYQGERPPFPPDLSGQLDLLEELATAFGFAAAKLVPWEADDLLASATAREQDSGGRSYVLTSDRDAYQLVSASTTVLVPRRGGGPPESVDRAAVRERYGVEPEQVVDLIALRGDPSDNIPGARGIGQKTAAELLRCYGSLDGVLANAHEQPERRRAALLETADDLRRYRRVAEMRRDLPLPDVPDAGLDATAAAAWAEGRGIEALARRLADRAVTSG